MARLVLTLDNQVLAEFNMVKERYTIGRLPDNDVRIDNATVSSHHCLIHNILNDSFLEDLNSTNGTYVNDKLIKKHALQHGDVITIGRHQLRFVDGSQDAGQADDFAGTMMISRSEMGGPGSKSTSDSGERGGLVRTAKIQVLNGQFAGEEVALSKALTTMGQPGVQVIAITRRGEGYQLVQLVSAGDREPAKINGEPIGDKARRLKDSDVIELTGIKLGFFID